MDKDMNRDVIDSLEADRLYRKMDDIYHIYTRSCGFSDMALWLLYSLYSGRREIIRLEPVSGNKKSTF